MTGDTTSSASLLSAPFTCDPGGTTPSTPEDVWVYNQTTDLASLTFSTAGSSLDTILYIRSPDCAVAGTLCSDDAGGSWTSMVTVTDPTPGYWFAIVEGNWNAVGPYNIAITGVVDLGGACTVGDTNFVCELGSTCVGGVCVGAACNNMTDDDGDGDVDYPFDPGCTNISDNDETDPPTPPQCADGLDNDADTFTDYPADTSCTSAADDDESCISIGTDTYGYEGCVDTPAIPPCDDITATGSLGCSGDDCMSSVPIGFTFDYYGVSYTNIDFVSNGKLGFGASTSYSNTCTIENNTIAAYWDDLYPPSGGSLRYQTMGTAPNRRFVANWNIPHISGGTTYDIRAVLYEGSNDIDVCYVDITTANPGADNGISATTGIRGSAAGDVINYTCNTAITEGTAVRYEHP
jgi:hypothetical protein